MTTSTTPGEKIRSDIVSFARDLSASIAEKDRDGAASRLERGLRVDRSVRVRVTARSHGGTDGAA